MAIKAETRARLEAIGNVCVSENEPLAPRTRFGIGGPADFLVATSNEVAFQQALEVARASEMPYTVIGGGTNLIASDEGFPGVVLQYTAADVRADGYRVFADAGAELQSLVDFTIERGLRGFETMTGIPGWVGAAVYGNAGAYGHSIQEWLHRVRFFDGSVVRCFDNAQCRFAYRESIFKKHKQWILFSAEFLLPEGDAAELAERAAGIRKIRDAKYPPDMKCAGSIFKNLVLRDLPPSVAAQTPERIVRDGKAPSGWFLEEVGAKGMKNGDIHVAEYHGNLLYNAGAGTARQVAELIAELKWRVAERFGFMLEEEVQYVGLFDGKVAGDARDRG